MSRSPLQIFSLFLLISSAATQITEECQHRSGYQNGSYYILWSSFPPLSVNESAIDVYCCMEYNYLFHRIKYRFSSTNYVGIALGLQEAHKAFMPWMYSRILEVYCDHVHQRDCLDMWRANYSDYLIGSHTFSDLKANTLYTVATLACYHRYYFCTVARARFVQYSNITTKPEVPRFHITSSTTTSITVQFPYNYYTGPPPHGHEVVVENKDLNSVLSYSHYFQISILHAVISDLSPNTEYVLHIRANGSHHAGNYGQWKSVEVKTQPVVPAAGSLKVTISPRDTAAVLTLSPALPYQHFDTFLFTWHQEGDPGTVHETNVTVEEGGVLFLEGLKQGQKYIGNWNGNSNFKFETTKYVEVSITGESIQLKWSAPSVAEGVSITGYEASVVTAEETRVAKYFLSSSGRDVKFEGLQPLTAYEVKLRVRVRSRSGSAILQPFYSTNLTTVERANTEAVINGVIGAAVMLLIVCLVTGVVMAGFLIVKKKQKIPLTGDAHNLDIEGNPAYIEVKAKEHLPRPPEDVVSMEGKPRPLKENHYGELYEVVQYEK